MTRARLDAFTGTWTGTGEFLEGAGPGAGARLRTSHRYTWLTGEFFMLYQGTLDFGAGSLTAHRVLGFDEDTGSYTMHAFDSLGFARQYHGSVDGVTWHFYGPSERVTFTFGDDGARLSAFWENRADGQAWAPLCRTEEARG